MKCYCWICPIGTLRLIYAFIRSVIDQKNCLSHEYYCFVVLMTKNSSSKTIDTEIHEKKKPQCFNCSSDSAVEMLRGRCPGSAVLVAINTAMSS